jgi:hypothetical protein
MVSDLADLIDHLLDTNLMPDLTRCDKGARPGRLPEVAPPMTGWIPQIASGCLSLPCRRCVVFKRPSFTLSAGSGWLVEASQGKVLLNRGDQDDIMIEDVVYSISSSYSFIPSTGQMHEYVLFLSILFSLIGAIILGRFTGAMGSLTLPLNFSALFIGSITSNWLMRGIDLNLDAQVQRPLVGSLIGMLIASLMMLRWIRGDHRQT